MNMYLCYTCKLSHSYVIIDLMYLLVCQLLRFILLHLQDNDVIKFILLSGKRWERDKNTERIIGRKEESEG